VDDINLSDDDEAKYINLIPFVNPNPYFVQQDMSLGKVYSLFRNMALRHLFVIKRVEKAVGIITRKDLLHEFSEQRHETLRESTQVERQERSTELRERKRETNEVTWSPDNARTKPLGAHETVGRTSGLDRDD